MQRFLLIAAAVCFCAAAASAQTKVSGTLQCAKADPVQAIPVGDRPDHSLVVEQSKCTYTKPLEIEGDKSKDGLSTATADVNGDSSKARGFHIVTMESGDKAFFWYQGTAKSKEGAPLEAKGSWGLTGGSGKLKGIKGKGTYNCTPSGDGLSCEVEGEYQLAK
ncbi:MAG: hypothetical protein DMG40_10135 [Acidobacteria bacterium]|nr:MAG: hypothetical protein DMG40_10135 [Acidobacteriota bacterium]